MKNYVKLPTTHWHEVWMTHGQIPDEAQVVGVLRLTDEAPLITNRMWGRKRQRTFLSFRVCCVHVFFF